MFAKCVLMSVVSVTFASQAVAETNQGKKEGEKQVMKYEIEEKELTAQPALVVKGKVSIDKAGEAIGGTLGAVEAYLSSKKLQPVGAPFTRTYSFENGVLEFESGFPVAAGGKGQGNVMATELPKGKVATTIHVGPQATSEEAYAAIHAWMAKHGKKPAGAPWEVYLTDPAKTPESQAKMQIFFPVK